MKNPLHLLTLSFACAMAVPAFAQIELKLQLQPDGITYTAFARSQVDLLPPLANITHVAQVVVTVPTGAFEVGALSSHAGQWQLTNLVQHPAESPGTDYALFRLTAPTDGISYPAGQDVPLFSFRNRLGCTGSLDIMHPSADPFLPPNSLGLPVRSELIVEGVGASNAISGRYDVGSADCFRAANCLITCELELLPSHFYQISLSTNAAFIASDPLTQVQVSVRVPTNFFQIHDLTNLLPGQFSFSNISRHDSPAEDDAHDYLTFRLSASGSGLYLLPGTKTPLLRFANGGSCQGDSIFLVNINDPFLPPNSQAANLGQSVRFGGGDTNVPLCLGTLATAPCEGCLFTAGLVKLDSVQSANPVACLGGMNGMLRLFAHGAPNLEFSVDGGQNWSASGYFGGLGVGTYHPQVRGNKFGCSVTAIGPPVELLPGTDIDLQLEAPVTTCEGSDVQFKIMSPNPLPANASFAWTGPQGFDADFADPVVFDINSYQAGNYTLVLTAPGCDPAVAATNLEVKPLPAVPDLLTNGPICFGDKLKLFATTSASAFGWYGPLGTAQPALVTTDSLVYIDETMSAYVSGNWQLQVTNEHGCTAMSAPVATRIKPKPQAFAETSGPACLGGEAQLFSNPLPGATYEWRRQGEATIFSMQPNPLITNVSSPQTFTLLVWQDGCISSVPAIATVSLSQTPNFSPTYQYVPATDCSPKPLTLSVTAIGLGLSYTWSGPNGFGSQAASPVIPAANSANNGTYTVQLSNIFGCSATKSLLVTGITDPVAQPLVQSSGPACPGTDLELFVQPYTASQVSYQWFKGTTPMFGQNSNSLIFNGIQPNSEGSYKLRATVDGCVVESASHPVDVLEKPQPNPDFYLSQPCEGGILQFFSNQNGIANWHWTGPGGFASDAPTPVIYQTDFATIGAYQLTVTGLNGCTAAASLLIDGILPVPTTPLVASNSPVCPGADMIFTVQNPTLLGTVDYEWQNGNGGPVGTGEATLTLPVGDPLAVPPFLVKTIVNTCPSPLSDPVSVAVLPDPVAMAWSAGAVCEGEAAQLFAASQPNVSYEWQVAGQVVSIEQNPTLLFVDSTDIQLIVKTDACATEATTSITVPVNPVPNIAGLVGGGTFCEGSPVSLSASNDVPLAGAVQYAWTGWGGFNFTGSAASAGPFPLAFASIAPQNEGSYTLMLTSAEGCVSAPQSVAVEVSAMPATPIVTVADADLCEGETLQLDATPAMGNNVSYDWFFTDGTSNVPLGATSYPTYLLPSVNTSQSGSYFVRATADGCQTPPSNLALLTVISLPTGVLATNPTTSLTPACEGTDIPLSATLLPGASYHWYGPTGFFADVPNPLVEAAGLAQAGDYLVVIGYPACSTTLAFETTVFLQEAPAIPLLTGDAEACEGTDVQLSVTNVEAGAEYDFYFGQTGQPFSTTGGLVFLEDVGTAQSGSYFASASLNGCESALSTAFDLDILASQTDIAFAGPDQSICEASEIQMLQATPPTVGTGHWTALDGATLVQPTATHSAVLGLQPGENRFVWALTNGICPGSGSDTVVVFLEKIEATEDFYSLALNDSLLNINLLENDFTQNTPDFDFIILTKPIKGQLLDDSNGAGGTGRVTYIPYPNAFGEDSFRYRLCSMNCPDVCADATVHISLNGSVAAEDCFRPNLITPDGDGLDDVFVIPCAVGWPGSSILIFNRWGATVFESNDYQNDWAGNYNGEPLPPATYFYQLRLNDGRGTVLQGYVAVE